VGLTEEILAGIEERPADAVAVGRRYAAVRVGERVGVARSFLGDGEVPARLAGLAGSEIGRLALSRDRTEAAVGTASLNAQLPLPVRFERGNVFDLIREMAPRFERIGVVGMFPFVKDLEDDVTVFEEREAPGCLPASEAAAHLPRCDLVVITGSAFINQTLEGLLARSGGYTMVIGPSTPLSPILFRHGADLLAGVSGGDPAVLDAVGGGGGTRSFIRRMRTAIVRRDGQGW